MARIIKCDDTYLAYVNRAGYKREIPKPKLPIGVKIHRGKYVIAAAIYKGDDLVEVNNDYVYEDGRKCRVIPCDVK